MTASLWQRRIKRAEELAEEHPYVAEILRFYASLARFQGDLYQQLTVALSSQAGAGPLNDGLDAAVLQELTARFESYLFLVEKRGPQRLAGLGQEVRARGQAFWNELLNSAWTSQGADDVQSILALAFLQPYAMLLRTRSDPSTFSAMPVCPFCRRRPVVGVLRPKSESSARSLVCSFCLNEWEFRRLVCPACGEESDRKLVVYTANSFEYIRIECCETCKTYLKTVDLTKNGLADPIVDELASAPLDLWARERNYAKLHTNILGL